MRVQLLAALFVFGSVLPRLAEGKEFGDKGTVELGGEFDISSGSNDVKFEGSPSSTTNSTDVNVGPRVGYFVADGVEVLGLVNVGFEVDDFEGDDKDQANTFSIGAGGAYLVKAGTMRIGPQLSLAYLQSKISSEDAGGSTDITFSGPLFDIRGVAKVPVGGGGLISIGLGLTYGTLGVDIESGGASADGDLTFINYGTNVGFSVFF